MWATRVGNWDIHPRMKKTHFNSIVKDFTSKSSKKLWKNEFANIQSKTVYDRKTRKQQDYENDYFGVDNLLTSDYDGYDNECCDIGTSNLNVE